MQQADQSRELTGPNIHLIVTRKPVCHIEYQVALGQALIEQATAQAIKKVRKYVSLPGFRKGKVPEALVLKNYFKEVDKETQEILAQLAWQESDKLAHEPLLQKDTKVSYQVKSRSPEKAEFVLSFETEPLVPVVDIDAFQLQDVPRPEIDGVKIDEMIRQTRLFFAEWVPITERAIEEGDFVLLDVEDLEQNPPQKVFSHTRFEVTDRSMAGWMKSALLGMVTGSSKEVVSLPDPDVKEEEKAAFPEKKVRITVITIEQPKLPDMDEAFAKKLGVNSPEEIEGAVARILNQQADAHVMEKWKEQVAHFLLTQYPFELPATLIEKEASFRLSQLFKDASFRAHWDSLQMQGRQDVARALYEQSDKAVRLFYICRKLLADAKISVSPQHLPKHPHNPLETLLNSPEAGHQELPHELQQAEAYARLLLEEAEQYLIGRARDKLQIKE